MVDRVVQLVGGVLFLPVQMACNIVVGIALTAIRIGNAMCAEANRMGNRSWDVVSSAQVRQGVQKGFLGFALILEAFTVFWCLSTYNLIGAVWNGISMWVWWKLFEASHEIDLFRGIETMIREMRQANRGLQESILERERIISDHEELIQRLEASLRSLETNNRDLERQWGEIKELTEKKAQLQKEYDQYIRSHQQAVEDMKGMLEAYQQRMEKVKRELDEARTKYAEMQERIKNSLQELRRVTLLLAENGVQLPQLLN